MLFEVVGLGCGFGPLNNRFFPPMGSILYWLRPGTIRLPPWPHRVPLTTGPPALRRHAALRGADRDLWSRCSRRDRPDSGAENNIGVLPIWQIWTSWPARGARPA